MALDKDFFDSISIELIDGKYYDAQKVNEIIEDIRSQAISLSEDNNSLRELLDAHAAGSGNTGSADKSADAVVEAAEARAAEILADAQRKSDRARDTVLRQQDYAVKRVGECMEKLRLHQMKSIELINSEWQDFLCNLDVDSEEVRKAYPDLETKLEAIGNELRLICEDIPEDDAENEK